MFPGTPENFMIAIEGLRHSKGFWKDFKTEGFRGVSLGFKRDSRGVPLMFLGVLREALERSHGDSGHFRRLQENLCVGGCLTGVKEKFSLFSWGF